VQEKQRSRSREPPEIGDAGECKPDLPTGEEKDQLGYEFPIAGVQVADPSIVRSFEDIYDKLRTLSTCFATEQNTKQPDGRLMKFIGAVAPDVREPHHVKDLVLNRRSRRHLVEAIIGFVICSYIFGGFDEENRASSSPADFWMPSEMAAKVHFIECAFKENGESSFHPC
jgi:hypothetical protein